MYKTTCVVSLLVGEADWRMLSRQSPQQPASGNQGDGKEDTLESEPELSEGNGLMNHLESNHVNHDYS